MTFPQESADARANEGHGAKSAAVRERAVLALLTERSIANAARKSGVNEKTLRRWLSDDETFKAEYAAARQATFEAGMSRVQALVARAVDTLDELLDDKKASRCPSWRRKNGCRARSSSARRRDHHAKARGDRVPSAAASANELSKINIRVVAWSQFVRGNRKYQRRAMIEDKNGEPGDIDDDSFGEQLDDLVGVSEIDRQEAVAGYAPIQEELFVLVKYWMTQVMDDDFLGFCFQQTCSWRTRQSLLGNHRINRISAKIGEDEVKRAIDEAYKEYGEQQHNSEAWRIFLHGTDDERRQFREDCDAADAAIAREHRDQFYADVLKFLAGEPHDIGPGTVGMCWAEDAKRLVRENPALATPENKDVLLKEIGYL